jgi:hypothetical protein
VDGVPGELGSGELGSGWLEVDTTGARLGTD